MRHIERHLAVPTRRAGYSRHRVEADAVVHDVPLRKYTWGRDTSGLTEPAAPTTGASQPPAPATGALGTDGGSLLTAAGGIGGLVAVWDSSDTPGNTTDDLTYVYFYDANGNVSQVVDVGDLANWQSLGLTSPADWHASRLAARYEYDPYGNLIGPDTNADGTFDPNDAPGPYASRNPFRFSTKSFDSETGFGYWGYRYYWPKLGRWLNRDPIGELGGLNLYVYVHNTPLIATDQWGRYCAGCGSPRAPRDPDPRPGGGSAGDPGPPTSEPGSQPASQTSTQPTPARCPDEYCRRWCRVLGPGTYGVALCEADGRGGFTGKWCWCVCTDNINRDFDDSEANPIVTDCVRKHEEIEAGDSDPCNTFFPPSDTPGTNQECDAQLVALHCVFDHVNNGDCNTCRCLAQVKQFVNAHSCRPPQGQASCPCLFDELCDVAERMARLLIEVKKLQLGCNPGQESQPTATR